MPIISLLIFSILLIFNIMKIKKSKILNWSRTKSYYGSVAYPKNYKDLEKIIKSAESNEPIAFRAGGNSFGDCCLNDNGKLIDLRYLNKILNFNEKEKSLLVQCGTTMENLLNFIIPKGYYVNSVPGTDKATVGGCINSNVHGKDAHFYGVFANNVVGLKVMNSNGEILFLDRKDENFYHAIGSFGLTYLILEAKLKVTKITSSILEVNTIKFLNYDKMLELFEKYQNQKHQMMGAWINHFDTNGSGIFMTAKWSEQNEIKFKKINLLSNINKKIMVVIFSVAKRLFGYRLIIKTINYFFYIFAKEKKQYLHFSDFYFPQAKVLHDFSRFFPGGLINMQILIPKNIAQKLIKIISNLCMKYKMESWWCGVKKHKYDNFNLVFGLDGYCIVLQWPKKFLKKKDFNNFYSELIELIIKHNCLIYLIQDILLNKDHFTKIYKDHKKFYDIKMKTDPKMVFKNNLYNRLFN